MLRSEGKVSSQAASKQHAEAWSPSGVAARRAGTVAWWTAQMSERGAKMRWWHRGRNLSMAHVARSAAAFSMVLVLLQIPGSAAGGATPTFCGPGQSPQFELGFAFLKSAIGDAAGSATECEHFDLDGNGHQGTTTGDFFWNKSTNVAVFSSDDHHWAWTARGLIEWAGASLTPPDDATKAALENGQQRIIENN